MAETVDSLQIEIESSSTDAAGAIDRLTASLQRLGQAVRVPGLERLSRQMKALTQTPNTSTAKIEQEIARLEKQAEDSANSVLKLQKRLEGMQAYRGIGTPETAAGVEAEIQRAEKEIERLGGVIDAADNKIRALRKNLETGMQDAAAPIERVTGALAKIPQAPAAVIDDESIKKAAASCERLASAAEKAQKSLETSVQYVVDALTAVVLPILTAIEPIVTAILDGIAEVLNFIARVVAAFTGQDTVLQAVKTQKDFADSVDGSTSSTDKLTNAAKKLKSVLLGIDELNVIEKDPPLGGGGSGDLGNFRFEEVENNLKFPEIKFPNLDKIPSPEWSPNPVPAPEFAPVTLPELSGVKLKAPAWEPSFVPAPAFEPLTVPSLAGERLLSPEWVPGFVPSPVFEPVLVPDLVGEKLPSPVWEPGFVHSPVFEPVPVPDIVGQKLPSPSWSPDVIRSPVFEPVPLPDLVGELLRSPAWSPSVVRAPIFEQLLIPDLVGKLLKAPEWMPSVIPAPAFEALTLPEWALSPLPVPAWSQNPILAPVLDNSPVLSGLAAMVAAFASNESSIGEKLQLMQQKFSSFVTATQTNLAAWGANIKTNFSTVIEFIPKVTSLGLLPSAKTFGAFLTVTAGALASWGPNIAGNVSSVLEFIPKAVHDGLTAAGTPFVDWVNKTSSGVADWAGNLAENAGKGISAFVQNFLSGLSAAWEAFTGFMRATGERISGWWSANKSWAAPVGAVALAGAGVAAFVLSGGAAAVTAAIPKLAPLALPAMGFANGGVVKSPTLALMGEYPSARTNPEIIAPQNILRQTFREEQGRQDNSDVISAINAGIGAIVEAINASGNRPVTIDGKTLMQSVERAQRQRGANIMGGGVLG